MENLDFSQLRLHCETLQIGFVQWYSGNVPEINISTSTCNYQLDDFAIWFLISNRFWLHLFFFHIQTQIEQHPPKRHLASIHSMRGSNVNFPLFHAIYIYTFNGICWMIKKAIVLETFSASIFNLKYIQRKFRAYSMLRINRKYYCIKETILT